ncbi:hypothetical protein PMAYCL1PPCAC_21126, partial [Pristionchus mayeri]
SSVYSVGLIKDERDERNSSSSSPYTMNSSSLDAMVAAMVDGLQPDDVKPYDLNTQMQYEEMNAECGLIGEGGVALNDPNPQLQGMLHEYLTEGAVTQRQSSGQSDVNNLFCDYATLIATFARSAEYKVPAGSPTAMRITKDLQKRVEVKARRLDQFALKTDEVMERFKKIVGAYNINEDQMAKLALNESRWMLAAMLSRARTWSTIHDHEHRIIRKIYVWMKDPKAIEMTCALILKSVYCGPIYSLINDVSGMVIPLPEKVEPEKPIREKVPKAPSNVPKFTITYAPVSSSQSPRPEANQNVVPALPTIDEIRRAHKAKPKNGDGVNYAEQVVVRRSLTGITPMTEELFVAHHILDTDKLAKEITHVLFVNNITQKRFGDAVLGLSNLPT